MIKWEYKVRNINQGIIIEDLLNQYGKDGWELVTVYQYGGVSTPVIYLKRERVPDKFGR